ncbi:MAG: stage 0 sporulation protein [Clostridiales bacterium]|nr:stage 0 sporulation protein [Clostridiales bacterium]
MAKIVGVRFKNAGKLFYFDPGELWPNPGAFVIVDTVRGQTFGQVITGMRETDEETLDSPLKPILRIATEDDILHMQENEEFEKTAFDVCLRKIGEHQLEMKLVQVEQTFDNSKIVFYFTANGRVDFRSLVKDLASVFHTRIELRQIGVRDEARMIGGLGPCGLPICCGTFLGDFQPVSIKMAKEQNLSLNPTKISGVCGRLMCCLKFEDENYVQTRKRMPKLGKDVETPDGFGTVIDLDILKEKVSVRIHHEDSSEIRTYSLDDIVWFKMDREGRSGKSAQDTKRRGRAALASADENAEAEDDADAYGDVADDDEEEASGITEDEEFGFPPEDDAFEQEPLSEEIADGAAVNNWQEEVAQALKKSDGQN